MKIDDLIAELIEMRVEYGDNCRVRVCRDYIKTVEYIPPVEGGTEYINISNKLFAPSGCCVATCTQ
jgi:hypothetical protein